MDLSIVIPCRNEEKFIELCLKSVLNAAQNFSVELIVVDGMSTDKTKEIVSEIMQSDNRVKLFENQQQTTPFALNIGIDNSVGEYIMILGAHSEMDKNYISRLMEVFQENPEAHCVGGLLENVYENKISEIIGKAMSSPFGVGNAHFRTGAKSGFVDTVAFGTYKREVFEEIGKFDVDLARNQDDEFNYRMIANNMKIFLDKDLSIKYFVRASFKKLFRQYYQYGFWKVYVNKKHKSITTIRQLIPFLFVGFMLASALLAVVLPKSLIFSLPFFLLYIILSLYSATKKSFKLKEIVLISYTFLILHFSYGFGYLWGIIWFLIFQQKPSKKHQELTR